MEYDLIFSTKIYAETEQIFSKSTVWKNKVF